MRIRLADKIIADIEFGEYDMGFSLGFVGPSVIFPSTKGIYTRDTYHGYKYYLEDSAIKPGDWRFYRAYRCGPFWNRRNCVYIEKFNGARFVIVSTFTQDEIDRLCNVWNTYMPNAIEVTQRNAQQKLQKIADDAAWHP